MKLTNKVALISGLGCLALVGTGFAAWVYNEETDLSSDAAAASAVVAPAEVKKAKIVLGNDAKTTYTFTLDQLATNDYHGQIKWDANGAMSFTATLENDYTAGENESATFDVSDYNLYYTVVWSNTAISTYVTDVFTDAVNATAGHTWVSGQKIGYSIAWNSSTVVDTLAKYETMRDAVKGVTVQVTFHAEKVSA